MSDSMEINANGSSARAKVGRAGQVVAKNSESWIVNAASAPASVGEGLLFALTSTWNTRGAWAFGAACIVCGFPIVLGGVIDFGVGALTAGSSRPLPQDANTFVRLGRGTARTSGAVLRVVTTSVSEGVEATQADDRGYDEAPRRVTSVRNRRPEAYRNR